MDKLFKPLPKFLVIFLTTVLVCTFLYHVNVPSSQKHMSTDKFNYPATRKGEQVDNYHGTEVADYYRWLENPDSEETETWVEAQNKVTFNFLEKIPARDDIKKRLTKLWDYEKYGVPYQEGKSLFLF